VFVIENRERLLLGFPYLHLDANPSEGTVYRSYIVKRIIANSIIVDACYTIIKFIQERTRNYQNNPNSQY
jgi:hypothetical protein